MTRILPGDTARAGRESLGRGDSETKWTEVRIGGGGPPGLAVSAAAVRHPSRAVRVSTQSITKSDPYPLAGAGRVRGDRACHGRALEAKAPLAGRPLGQSREISGCNMVRVLPPRDGDSRKRTRADLDAVAASNGPAGRAR